MDDRRICYLGQLSALLKYEHYEKTETILQKRLKIGTRWPVSYNHNFLSNKSTHPQSHPQVHLAHVQLRQKNNKG